MKDQKIDFLQKLKYIFLDISLLYRNFIHWNISKGIIAIWSFVLWIICSLPFFLLVGVLSFLDPIEWSNIIGYLALGQAIDFDVLGGLLEYPFYVLLEVFLILLWIVALIIGSSYGVLLRTNLYFSYIKKRNLSFRENFYFQRWMFAQYIRVFFRILGYLVVPIIIFIALFLGLYILFRIELLSFHLFSVISFVCFCVTVISLIYMSFRIWFVYPILLDKKNVLDFPPAKEVLQTSRNITKGIVVFPFLLVAFIYWLFVLPFNMVEETLNTNGSDAKMYLAYKTGQLSIQTEETREIYAILQVQFEWKTDNEVVEDIVWLGRAKLLFIIVSFLLISGTFEMLAVSFYLHFLQKTKKKSLVSRIAKKVLKKTKKEL